MKTLACGDGSHEEVNNGTTVPLKKGPFRVFSSHPFHGWLLTFNIYKLTEINSINLIG
jgi:hypothetical protein